MPAQEKRSLPMGWYIFLAILALSGLAIFYFNPQLPPWADRITTRVHAAQWPRLISIYLLSIVITHFVVYLSLYITSALFDLEPSGHQRRNLWPPALLGLVENVLYPTAFLLGRADFIGLWLLLKVAGQWPRWGLDAGKTRSAQPDALQEGRRRYYQFLIGNALMVFAGLATYGVMKVLVLNTVGPAGVGRLTSP